MGADRRNDILMSLLLLVAEAIRTTTCGIFGPFLSLFKGSGTFVARPCINVTLNWCQADYLQNSDKIISDNIHWKPAINYFSLSVLCSNQLEKILNEFLYPLKFL